MIQVSVITPCYNAARFVAQTMASVRAQTGVALEHVIVDDGSTDDTADVVRGQLKDDGRARLVQRPNQGVGAARNEGFRAASPDSRYLLFLDADDWIEPGMLERLVSYLDERPHVGVVYCDPFVVDDEGRPLNFEWPARLTSRGAGVRRVAPDDPHTPFESVYAMAGIIPSIALIRRSTYEKTPGWDESLGQPCEDTDLFLHLALEAEIHFIPERYAYYRIHAGQSVRDQEKLDRQHVKLYEKWHAKAKTSARVLDRIDAAHRLFRVAQLADRLSSARRHLREGRPLVAARFALGAARRFILPPLGTVEAVGRGAHKSRRSAPGIVGSWSA